VGTIFIVRCEQILVMGNALEKTRLDQLLVERGLAESRERAQRLIRAGLVVVGEHRVDKPGARVDAAATLRLKGDACPYVSRGGLKLAGALDRFGMTGLTGIVALDVGASTGGFTDCLLQRGAARVWAVDTGRGQLHERLRRDPRVRVIENANARELAPAWLAGERVGLAVVDVSFISLRLIIPPLAAVLAPGGTVVALIKPQFEAGPADVGKGGVVRRRSVHRRVLEETLAFARAGGWAALGLCPSPLLGPAGNVEFFLRLARAAEASEPGEIAIETALNEAYHLRDAKPSPREATKDSETRQAAPNAAEGAHP
jgi:23S rRNA (cytidine1920-2'-O)/16S rRNA (cytidine1409-2'-O)-methyltransferase